MEAFVAAANDGDLDSLERFLAEDVVAISDGGGKVSAALIPLEGFERVTTVLRHLMKNLAGEVTFTVCPVNDDWGIEARTASGELHSVTAAIVVDGAVRRLFIWRNPAKLRHMALESAAS